MKEPPETRQPEGGKKRYSKPIAERVLLRAEEAVLGICKTGASAGPTGPTCNSVGTCSSLAS